MVAAPTLFGDFGGAAVAERFVQLEDFDGVPCYLLDIPETIPQLGYGSHQFFRYYGKFPSILGREIVKRFAPRGTSILDCYAGSGTTLVEAQINSCPSYGIDINPLGVLACNVKTRYYDRAALRNSFIEMTNRAVKMGYGKLPSGSSDKISKWFTEEAVRDLGRLRAALEGLPAGDERDFLSIAFLGIIRRCSNAYDGEVRPHINLAKRPRPPFEAFSDKFEDMYAGLQELDGMRSPNVPSQSVIGDSRSAESYEFCADKSIELVVAHPPYLNSFNYLQVFSLEFMWSDGLPEVWGNWTPRQVRTAEQRAWPATNPAVTARYYQDFWAVAKAATSVMADGAVLSVVVGDATIRQTLEPVHKIMWEHLKTSGLEPVEIWFRTTHYGIGKYAYSHRADYHGDAEKKDVIMFFRKVADTSRFTD
jgi:hypothetical protein